MIGAASAITGERNRHSKKNIQIFFKKTSRLSKILLEQRAKEEFDPVS
nr:MAG TPA: hypothetical protein [Caudoviricetes sp.]